VRCLHKHVVLFGHWLDFVCDCDFFYKRCFCMCVCHMNKRLLTYLRVEGFWVHFRRKCALHRRQWMRSTVGRWTDSSQFTHLLKEFSLTTVYETHTKSIMEVYKNAKIGASLHKLIKMLRLCMRVNKRLWTALPCLLIQPVFCFMVINATEQPVEGRLPLCRPTFPFPCRPIDMLIWLIRDKYYRNCSVL